ncbi:MAG: ACT domain-containing protein [Gemmatimonadota bacterium]
MTNGHVRTYVVDVDGGLLGLERVIGVLRRRNIAVLGLSARPGAAVHQARLTCRVSSTNHDQVRRQLSRLIEVAALTDMEETRDDAA